MEGQQIPDVYSNAVQFNTSIFELMVTFALSQPDGENAPLFRVRMSPQHAKAMYLLLKKNLEVYEDRFGEILLPDKMIENLTSAEVVEEE